MCLNKGHCKDKEGLAPQCGRNGEGPHSPRAAQESLEQVGTRNLPWPPVSLCPWAAATFCMAFCSSLWASVSPREALPFQALQTPGPGCSLDQGPLPGAKAEWDVTAPWLCLAWWGNKGAPDNPRDLTCLFSGNITSGSQPHPSPLHHLPNLRTHHQCLRLTDCPSDIFIIALKWRHGGSWPTILSWRNAPPRAFRCQPG